MAKFPDPTKSYTASPVDDKVNAAPATSAGTVGGPATTADVTTSAPPASEANTVYTASTQTDTAPTPAPQSEIETPNTPPPAFPEPSTPEPVGTEALPATQANGSGVEEPTLPAAPQSAPSLPVSPSPFRNLIPVAIAVVVLGILAFLGFSVLPKLFSTSTGPINLTYWGLWEPSSVMDPLIASYESTHPNVKITYTMESPQNYRSRIQSAVSQGNSPDIVRIHNTWLPEMVNILSPAPDTVMTTSGLSAYYPIVQKNAVSGGKVYALPMEIDGLALFYNQDMLSASGATPPTDWNALRKLAYSLTKRDATTGIITQAGVAMGTTGNVEHWSDILGLLILQNSGDPSDPSSTAVQDALTFYTIFTTQDKIWDASQPNSIYAFSTGTVAMILAPSWEAAQIKAINPNLKFGIAPAPTLPSTNVAWATYWMEAVPSGSKHPAEAWDFIKYLSSTDSLQKLYTAESQIRPIGEPYPLTSMNGLLANDPLAGPFVSQGPSYTSWYMNSRTYDGGLNDQIVKYYEDAVNSIDNGSTVAASVQTLGSGVSQVLSQFPGAK